MLKDYLKLNKNEIIDLIFITGILGLLFSLNCLRFSEENNTFIFTYISFFAFIFILLSSRLLFMKFLAYKYGFEIKLRMTYFDRYGLRNYDRLSYTAQVAKYVDPKNYTKNEHEEKNTQYDFKGIPMPIISLTLYILTLGTIIFPSLWNYKIKQIPHRFMGTKSRYEKLPFFHVSNYRFSKIMFFGFLYYLLFGFIVKIILQDIGQSFYNWFGFAILWIAFFTLIPILGTEGYELYSRGRLTWFSTLAILVIGTTSLVIFQSLTYVITVTILSTIIVLTTMLWKHLMD